MRSQLKGHEAEEGERILDVGGCQKSNTDQQTINGEGPELSNLEDSLLDQTKGKTGVGGTWGW